MLLENQIWPCGSNKAVVAKVLCCDADEEVLRGRPFVDVEVREHFPAASSSQDTYTLLKFYNLSKDLVTTVLRVRLLFVDLPVSVCHARISPANACLMQPEACLLIISRQHLSAFFQHTQECTI